MSLFEHAPHPHLKHRAEHGAPTVGQAVAEHPSFNMRLAAWGTQKFGTMPAFYAFVIYGALGAVFTAYQATLLYWSNWVQLWSLPLIAVGSAVLAVGMNKMMKRQFDDVETILHEQDQAAQHLAAQDDKILAVLDRLDVTTDGGIKAILDAVNALAAREALEQKVSVQTASPLSGAQVKQVAAAVQASLLEQAKKNPGGPRYGQ